MFCHQDIKIDIIFGYLFNSWTLVFMPYELYSKWIRKIIALIHYRVLAFSMPKIHLPNIFQ